MPQGSPRGSMAAFLADHLDERLAARFWAKVNKNGPIPEHKPELGPCWVWTAATDPRGYGRFGVGSHGLNRVYFAHRVSLALAGQMPPDELQGCHHCDNPPCVRPDHLFIGTLLDNMADMAAKGRNHDDVCRNGHPCTPENTHIYEWGGYELRRCRACDRARDRKPSSRKCGEPGCDNAHAAKGLCGTHYMREKRRQRAAA